jgi:hypothetical protein
MRPKELSARGCERDQPCPRACTRWRRDAFRELTDRYGHELQVHIYRIVWSAQAAEDLLQETLLAAWRGLDQFQAARQSVPGCTGLRRTVPSMMPGVPARRTARRARPRERERHHHKPRLFNARRRLTPTGWPLPFHDTHSRGPRAFAPPNGHGDVRHNGHRVVPRAGRLGRSLPSGSLEPRSPRSAAAQAM